MRKGSVKGEGTTCRTSVGKKDSVKVLTGTVWCARRGGGPGGVPRVSAWGPGHCFDHSLWRCLSSLDWKSPRNEMSAACWGFIFLQFVSCHNTYPFKVTLEILTFFNWRNCVLIIENLENIKKHKIIIKITLNSTILRKQTLDILAYFYILKILMQD